LRTLRLLTVSDSRSTRAGFRCEINGELGKCIIELVLLLADGVMDAEATDAAHTTHQWHQLKLKFNRLQPLDFARDLGVAPANQDLALALSLGQNRQLQAHESLGQVVQAEADALRLLQDETLLLSDFNLNFLLACFDSCLGLSATAESLDLVELERALITQVVSPGGHYNPQSVLQRVVDAELTIDWL